MPAPRRPRLKHVPVRLRVSIDPEAWGGKTGRELTEAVRLYVVERLLDAPDIVAARRDGL